MTERTGFDRYLDRYPTMKWDEGKFFYEYTDGELVPTHRPHSWVTEGTEQRMIAALKRKGYRFHAGVQLWTGGTGICAHVVPIREPFSNDEWKYVGGDTVAEMFASIKKLPEIANTSARSEG